MKKVINGRMYNTATATELCAYESSHPQSDFHWWREELYRKRTGEFFLYAEGGPCSRHAEAVQGGRGYGYHIIPLTDGEATDWVEEYGDTDDYVRIFGEPEE